MRKVLLTTTALVALGGVSAASALEISGNYEFTTPTPMTAHQMTGGSNSTVIRQVMHNLIFLGTNNY